MRTLRLLLLFSLLSTSANAREILQEVVVSPGDTLWGIATRYLKDPKLWTEIVKYNKLSTADPTVALPGTKIKIPVLLIKEKYRNAQLIKMIPEVRYKRKGKQEWKKAGKNMTLHYEDSLRTMKGAKAHVQFPSKEVVQINENTYVVLKPEKILQEIELLKGEVRASRAKVIMPRGTVVKPKGGKSDYQAKIRDDDTEVVFVYKGKVDVTAQGKTVTVPEGYGTEVPKFSPPKAPAPLTTFKDFDPSELTALATGKKFDPTKMNGFNPTRELMKMKNKRKSKSISSEGILANYHLQLAKDEDFVEVMFEKNEPIGTMFDIQQADLPDGSYYMRVAFTDALGVRGEYSQPTRIIKDTGAPVIKNLFPKEGQKFRGDEDYCDIIGEVEGAAMIMVNEEVVFINPKGRFSKFVQLKEGDNIIHVLARDAHGNETKVQRTVYYSPKR